MADSTDKLVFAAVKYLHAAPLAELLSEVCLEAEVIYDRPAHLAAMLADGRAAGPVGPGARPAGVPGPERSAPRR